MKSRRLIVGDLHGCLDELEHLLGVFHFRTGKDRLFSVGDVVGKGPKTLELLERLKALEAQVVRGNHDQHFLNAAEKGSQDPKSVSYLQSLGDAWKKWRDAIHNWPLYLDLGDVLIVHAGLHPGRTLEEAEPRVLMNIRTWDGKGADLQREENPPWFHCAAADASANSHQTVVFGHWAKRGLVNTPRFKGLDTGCVYGKALTGYCPEEDAFYMVPSQHAYRPIHRS